MPRHAMTAKRPSSRTRRTSKATGIVLTVMRTEVDQFSRYALVEMLALAGIKLEVTPHVARRVS